MEAVAQLTEMLQDSNKVPPQRQDFRKLSATYLCTAKPGGDSTCTRFSPGPSGNCSLQAQSDLGMLICLHTGEAK